jgi:hypothetical protein
VAKPQTPLQRSRTRTRERRQRGRDHHADLRPGPGHHVLQCRHLLDLLDSGANPHLVGGPFDIWCQAHMLPWVLGHIHMDSDLVRRWQGGDVDVSQRLPSDLILSAAAVEPRISEPSQPYLAMRALPSCLDPVEPLARGFTSPAGGRRIARGQPAKSSSTSSNPLSTGR